MKRTIAIGLLAALLVAACGDDRGAGEAAAPAAAGSPPATDEPPEMKLPYGAWDLSGLDGVAEVDLPTITIEFDHAQRRVLGTSGCNRYFAEYSGTAADLQIGRVGGTRMACPGPVMDIESRFLSTLEQARAVRSSAAVLELIDADGNVLLRFHPASAPSRPATE